MRALAAKKGESSRKDMGEHSPPVSPSSPPLSTGAPEPSTHGEELPEDRDSGQSSVYGTKKSRWPGDTGQLPEIVIPLEDTTSDNLIKSSLSVENLDYTTRYEYLKNIKDIKVPRKTTEGIWGVRDREDQEKVRAREEDTGITTLLDIDWKPADMEELKSLTLPGQIELAKKLGHKDLNEEERHNGHHGDMGGIIKLILKSIPLSCRTLDDITIFSGLTITQQNELLNAEIELIKRVEHLNNTLFNLYDALFKNKDILKEWYIKDIKRWGITPFTQIGYAGAFSQEKLEHHGFYIGNGLVIQVTGGVEGYDFLEGMGVGPMYDWCNPDKFKILVGGIELFQPTLCNLISTIEGFIGTGIEVGADIEWQKYETLSEIPDNKVIFKIIHSEEENDQEGHNYSSPDYFPLEIINQRKERVKEYLRVPVAQYNPSGGSEDYEIGSLAGLEIARGLARQGSRSLAYTHREGNCQSLASVLAIGISRMTQFHAGEWGVRDAGFTAYLKPKLCPTSGQLYPVGHVDVDFKNTEIKEWVKKIKELSWIKWSIKNKPEREGVELPKPSWPRASPEISTEN
jgi:hypothetical protein